MIKKTFLILILSVPFFMMAQKEIDVSEDYTTIIVFPSEIEEPILGNQQEYLIKESSNNSTLGKRTLRIGYIKLDNVEKNTNLTVFTKDGNSFEFLLKYVKTPKILNHYVKASESRQNLNASITKTMDNPIAKNPSSYYSENIETIEVDNSKVSEQTKNEESYRNDKNGYIAKNCALVNEQSKEIFRTFSKSSNIKLTLKQISYDQNELYFHLVLENDGGQGFDIDFINTKLARGYKGVSTDQSIPLTPLFIYNKPSRVEGNSEHNFIIVFEKFSINDKKELQIDLAEKEGERDLLLKISNKLINNPVKLKL